MRKSGMNEEARVPFLILDFLLFVWESEQEKNVNAWAWVTHAIGECRKLFWRLWVENSDTATSYFRIELHWR